MYVRVPTWLPCRLQIYFNVHHWLAARLKEAGIDFQMDDNCFVEIADSGAGATTGQELLRGAMGREVP